jgi:hypothetical protein
MTHGGEEVATHENRAPSSKLWAQLSAEQKAFAAMRKESFEEMKEAVEAGASVETVVHEHGFTAYHWVHLSAEQKAFVAAMLKENLEGMKEAVEAGASVETAVHGNGATAFHCAAGAAHFEMMEWLARKGADHSARDKQGGTPMHYASTMGHVAALKWLAYHGADITAVDLKGRSAMHTAVQNGHVAAAEWLEERIDGPSTLRAFTNLTYKPTPDTMHIATRLMKRRAKLDQKAVRTAPSALAVVGTDSDVYDGLYKKTGTYGGKATYTDGDGEAIWYDKELNGGSWVLSQASCIGTDGCRMWVASTAATPDLVQEPWTITHFNPCSTVQVINAKKKKGAQMLVIKGLPTDDPEIAKLNGKYRQQTGKQVYKGGQGSAIWFNGKYGTWCAGREKDIGTGVCSVCAEDQATSPGAVKAPWQFCMGFKQSSYPRVIVPSAEAAAKEVARRMQLELVEKLIAESSRCLGCGHTYEAEGEVVYRRACMHHHCMDCRGDEQGGCVVCAMEAEGK